jgi:hypothetical protein
MNLNDDEKLLLSFLTAKQQAYYEDDLRQHYDAIGRQPRVAHALQALNPQLELDVHDIPLGPVLKPWPSRHLPGRKPWPSPSTPASKSARRVAAPT